MKRVILQPSELELVHTILAKHVPDHEVRVFGSRYNGNVKPFSDLDLVIMGNTPINTEKMSALRESFSESDIPFKVDIIEWATTNESFRRIIEQGNSLLFP